MSTFVSAVCRPNGNVVQIIGIGIRQDAQEKRKTLIGGKVWEIAADRSTRKAIQSAFGNCVFTGKDQTTRFRLPDVSGGSRLWSVGFATAGDDVLVVARPVAVNAPELSDQQYAVLDAIIRGMSVKKIPEHIGTSESAVHRALRELRRKLGAENTHGIVVEARRFGLW